MIPINVKNEIASRLQAIETNEDVRVLYCVESGSRAWGFPSSDSDFDVRFIYIRRLEWYLSIDLEHRRDVIENPIVDEIDLNGWDIRKVFSLFAKSNPPLLEWLVSPIVYCDGYGFADELKRLLPTYYSATACVYHYLSMAKRNFREHMQEQKVRMKKYFYILRPLLAIRWIEQYQKPVPMAFSDLLVTIEDQNLRAEIEALIERKKTGEELSMEPAIPSIGRFIESELERLEKSPPAARKVRSNFEDLNVLFRRILGQVWANAEHIEIK